MNRLKVDACPHCLGRKLGERIVRDMMRNPLIFMLGGIVVTPPAEFGMTGAVAFMDGVAEVLEEYRASTRNN
jgi:hypothetical protein